MQNRRYDSCDLWKFLNFEAWNITNINIKNVKNLKVYVTCYNFEYYFPIKYKL